MSVALAEPQTVGLGLGTVVPASELAEEGRQYSEGRGATAGQQPSRGAVQSLGCSHGCPLEGLRLQGSRAVIWGQEDMHVLSTTKARSLAALREPRVTCRAEGTSAHLESLRPPELSLERGLGCRGTQQTAMRDEPVAGPHLSRALSAGDRQSLSTCYTPALP